MNKHAVVSSLNAKINFLEIGRRGLVNRPHDSGDIMYPSVAKWLLGYIPSLPLPSPSYPPCALSLWLGVALETGDL